MNIERILRNPVLVFVMFLLGIIIGLLQFPFVDILEVFGDIFLTLLELCMLPIIATMLTTSIYKVLKAKIAGNFLLMTIFFSTVFVVIVFIITLSLSWLMKSAVFEQEDFLLAASNLIIEGESGISNLIHEISTYIRPVIPETKTIGAMILDIFPDNAIKAFSESNVLQVVFFSIILGIASVTLPNKGSELITNICDSINHIFIRIFDFIMMFLAPAIFCIVAVQISKLGMNILMSLVHLLLMIIIICLVICVISMIVMCVITKTSVKEHFRAMGRPLYMAFATSDAIPTIPILIDNLPERHKVNKTAADTIFPICTTLFNYDGVILPAVSFIGATSIYDTPLKFGMIVTGFIITFLLSTSYSDILASSYLITLLLEPFGLPSGALIAMLIPLNPILDGLFTATKIYPVCVTAVVMSKQLNEQD